MDVPPGAADQMAEVVRLTNALADRVLVTHLSGQHVPTEQAQALAKAARLLQDCGQPWPTLLSQALHELADKMGDTPAEADMMIIRDSSEQTGADDEATGDGHVARRFLDVFKRKE